MGVEHKLLNEGLVLKLVFSGGLGFHFNNDAPNCDKGDVGSHVTSDDEDVLLNEGVVADFELLASDGHDSPDVDCAVERVAVAEGDDGVDYGSDPEHGEREPGRRVISRDEVKESEQGEETDDVGSSEPAHVEGHAESEANHLSYRELVADRPCLHDLSSYHHSKNNKLGDDEAGCGVSHIDV